MKISYELNLNSFNAWSGAIETLDRIRREGKCEELEAILEDLYPDGMDETELNDLLWFDGDTVLHEWLGLDTYDTVTDEIIELQEELDELEEELNDARSEEELDEDYINSLMEEISELKNKISELKEKLEFL